MLKKDAISKNTTTNALIHGILKKYLEWDRFAERYGFLSIAQDAFRTILDKIDDDKLSEASKELGERVPKDITFFWFGNADLTSFLHYLGLLSNYAKFAEFEISRNGLHVVVTAHHDLGIKWSKYLKSFLESGLKCTTGLDGSIEISRNSVVLTFNTQSSL